jgi:hypothetical protein
VRHEGTVNAERRIREDAAEIADFGFQISDLTANITPQTAPFCAFLPQINASGSM